MPVGMLAEATPHKVDDCKGLPLNQARLERAKAAYTIRRVDLDVAKQILTDNVEPRAGDLVLARVERLGQHARIELACGRRAHMHVGDEVIVAYGSRYAPDQFEAYVPADLGPCDLVAAGGVASVCRNKHSRMSNPTRLQPIGLLADDIGERLNLSRWTLTKIPTPENRPTAIAVVGTMMNAGKTTCAADLVHGYKQNGLRVGAAKITGTGAGCDRWALTDAGADMVLDFTDMGEPSTFCLSPDRVEGIFTTLTNHLAAQGFDVIILEVADGLYQRETAELLKSDVFRNRCEGLIFAASDALGAVAGVQQLEKQGYTVLAVGGAMTASPLATREAKQALSVPVVTSIELGTGRWLPFVPALRKEPKSAVLQLPTGRSENTINGSPHAFLR